MPGFVVRKVLRVVGNAKNGSPATSSNATRTCGMPVPAADCDNPVPRGPVDPIGPRFSRFTPQSWTG